MLSVCEFHYLGFYSSLSSLLQCFPFCVCLTSLRMASSELLHGITGGGIAILFTQIHSAQYGWTPFSLPTHAVMDMWVVCPSRL